MKFASSFLLFARQRIASRANGCLGAGNSILPPVAQASFSSLEID